MNLVRRPCAIEAVIRKARSDFYSDQPEIKRIADSIKLHLCEALIPLTGNESAILRAYGVDIYARFSGGLESAGITEHEAKPEVEVSK